MKYQKCPVCEGTGVVSRPLNIPADQLTYVTNSLGPWPCTVCDGKKIIEEVRVIYCKYCEVEINTAQIMQGVRRMGSRCP